MAIDGSFCKRRREAMVTDRDAAAGMWSRIAEYVEPNRNFNSGVSYSQPVIAGSKATRDTTLKRGLRVNASGQMEMIVPRSDKWFGFLPPLSVEQSNNSVRSYAEVAEVTADYMRASNFYTSSQGFLFDRSAYGIAAIWVEWDKLKNRLSFRRVRTGAFGVNLDKDGETVEFVEDQWLRLQDVMDFYPAGAIPRDLKEKFKVNPASQERVLVFHLCYRDRKNKALPWVLVTVLHESGSVLRQARFRSCPYTTCRYEDAPDSSLGCGIGEMALDDQEELSEHLNKLSELADQKIFPPMLVPDSFVGDVGFGAGEITTFNPLGGDHVVPRPLHQSAGARGDDTKWQVERLEKNIMSLCDVALFAPLAGVDRPQDMKATVASMLESYSARIAAPAYSRLVEEFLQPVVMRCLDLLIENGVVDKHFREHAPKIQFVTPFQINLDRRKPELFAQALSILTPLMQLDPVLAQGLDSAQIFQDVLEAYGLPVAWARDDNFMQNLRKEMQKAQMVQEQKASAETSNIMSDTLLNTAKANSL